MRLLSCVSLLLLVGSTSADTLQTFLAKEIIGPRQALLDVTESVDQRVPTMPKLTGREGWEREAERIRRELLNRVVYRGEAANWRDASGRVEWLGTTKGGPGYRVRPLRYEAVPGMWIPALLYEPDTLNGKLPVALAVNGHEPVGKAAEYKQIRCINMAKRGMIVLNPEWLGMGQLRSAGYAHGRMNQLDLCGTSGLAPFYLAMKRGLDLLLAHEHADAQRVCVSGLSGGGWQTIWISALDTRVTLSNPVAGYSSFRTRLRHHKDLGDSEQTPNDMATIADYTHLTALMAPRATLLTYNSKDNCCFESGYALPPLVDAARPVFALYGKESALQTHVNDDPGDHNFGQDNRKALYRFLGSHYFRSTAKYPTEELPYAGEVRTREELTLELPRENADFNSLARSLSQSLPRIPRPPADRAGAERWQGDLRKRLQTVVAAKTYETRAMRIGNEEKDGLRAAFWKLRLSDTWTVPVVELVRGEAKSTALVVGDKGRREATAVVRRLLEGGHRVLVLDPFYLGESRIEQRDYLFALLLATVGDRTLGIQASQVMAAARWSLAEHGAPVTLVAEGPRASLITLTAAALETKAINAVELRGSRGSLKEVIEENRSFNEMPEQFCFGLLEVADIPQISALVAPRSIRFLEPSARIKKEMSDLPEWYQLLGTARDPFR